MFPAVLPNSNLSGQSSVASLEAIESVDITLAVHPHENFLALSHKEKRVSGGLTFLLSHSLLVIV